MSFLATLTPANQQWRKDNIFMQTQVDILGLLLLSNRCHLLNICSLYSCSTSYLQLSKMRQWKEVKGIQIEKEEIKLPLFSNNIIFYIEDPKESPLKEAPKTFKYLCNVTG